MFSILSLFIRLIGTSITRLAYAFLHCTESSRHAIAPSTLVSLTGSKTELIAENALLRQQIVLLQRQVKKTNFSQSERLWFVLLASRVRNGRDTLLILKPDTLLRWPRKGFRLFWKFKSRNRGGRPKLSTETVSLIQRIAQANRLWEPARIHGELRTLGIRVATATIQNYVRQARPRQAPGQNWASFRKNHAKDAWACDFLPITALFFQPRYLFLFIELASRPVIHFALTSQPTDMWATQLLREAMPFCQTSPILIRERDSKYGDAFARVA